MKRLLISIAAAAACASAAAEGIDFKLSGFGTFGGVITNNDAGYRANAREPSGANKTVDYGVDSRLGLQGDLKYNDTFSAVGQLLSSSITDSNGLPVVEWLYGQANLPAGFKLKLGRMALPVFLLSDSRAVGYTQFWQREPIEVYQLYIPTHFDGAQLQYNGSLGPVSTTVQFSAGTAETAWWFFGPVHMKYSGLKSVGVTAEYGNWLARFGTTRGTFLVPELALSRSDRFDDYALQYDNGSLVVIGEIAKRKASGFDTVSRSIAAGWHFGAWTPYLQRSTASQVPFPQYSTLAGGLRWDPIKNVDIKIQVARVVGGAGSFATPSPQFLADAPNVHVLSLGVDFVF